MPRREGDQAASAKEEAAFSRFFFKHAAASRVYLEYGAAIWAADNVGRRFTRPS
jgi:hypothetical protein